MYRSFCYAWTALGCLGFASFGQASEPISADANSAVERVGFNDHIRQILRDNCVACHGGVKQASGLTLIYRESALSEADSGMTPIVPGDPAHSYLMERVTAEDPSFRMPPEEHGPALSEKEIELLRVWIAQGAEWEEHWSFVPPTRPARPEVADDSWPRQGLDSFILAQLEREGLEPSDDASKPVWLRRVSFDLIGLPPTVEELDEFLADDSAEAHERVVDRLLASEHFGERWATVWLDLARYADTMGYEKDPHRDIWAFRDWVIRAFNADLPFDEFTIRQLAGDLLPDATLSDRLATAFHRNTQTNTEGGTDDEEYRVAAVVDRLNTTWQAWQATTFGCAQCHDHPYDPIRDTEYYSFMAFFNSTTDYDVEEDLPKLAVPNDARQYDEADQLDSRIRALRGDLQRAVAELNDASSGWRNLAFDDARSTGNTQLVVRDVEGQSEVWAEGTITNGSQYELAGPVANGATRIHAIRVEGLPKDLDQAMRIPEMGFVLSRLRAFVQRPGDIEEEEISFQAVYCDQIEPLLDVEDSLSDNTTGWAAYPKIQQSHWAVFIPSHPVEAPAGSRIRFELKQQRDAVGQIPLVLQRARFWASTDDAWTKLVDSNDYRTDREALAEARSERRSIPSTLTPVTTELEDGFARPTFVFERGNWLERTDEVQAVTPKVMPPMPEGAADGRLGMAQWLVCDDNPLTARVMVNRAWQQLFGIGIVETAEDFGSSGALPSHPELLDYLATRYQHEFNWRLKPLLKEIVLSSTYRQTARVSSELQQRDPKNRLLARGPRSRLPAEMVRDQGLVVSGLFAPKQFGPPVMPPQPEGVWRSVYSGARWETDFGADRYRRAIYTYCKRTSGYPAFLMFDLPSREVCTSRRIMTNTPLQALVTLNDPAYLEFSQGLAGRMKKLGGDPTEQIAWAYRVASSQEATPEVVAELLKLYEAALTSYDANHDDAKQLADSAEGYARVIVANSILNLDEVLTK